MSDDFIEVWVELAISSGDNAASRPGAVKAVEGTHFRFGRTLKDAYMAADLMRKAQQSRKAAEDAINKSVGKHKRWGTNGALQKLKAFGGGKPSSMNMGERISVFVTLEDGTEIQVALQQVFPANKKQLIQTTTDLTGLTYMEEPNVLRSLKERYESGSIYTNIANIVVALNPYQVLNIYSAEYMMKYRDEGRRHEGPHIFSVGEEAYSALSRPFSLRRQEAPVNQSVIICGESGSGKTESAKYLMRYLANRSHKVLDEDNQVEHQRVVERQVLEANHILESFGNANTLLNHNSSRFGKFTKLYFATANIGAGDGSVVGASTNTYLLEKSRLVRQNPGERNFHIFYQICAGLQQDERAELLLDGYVTRDFHYINQGECFEVRGIDDRTWYHRMLKSLETLGIDAETRMQTFRVLSGLLHLGNIEFEEDPETPDTCKVKTSTLQHLEASAKMFGLAETESLHKRVTTIRIKTPGEFITKGLSVSEAMFNRDAIAKSVYDSLFRWVVDTINATLTKTQDLPWIGILDVFGFESFVNNSFEQFCINYANEMLQQHFNNAVLLSEQREYAKEAIMWNPIDVPDNLDTIELIADSKSGILSLLNSACKMRGTTVDAFVDSVFKQQKGHARLKQPSKRQHKGLRYGFELSHYAGKVTYNCDEFLVKNNDSTDPDTVALFATSTLDIITKLFKSDTEEDDETKDDKDKDKGPRRRRKAQTRFSSVSTAFKKQLNELLETLSSTEAYFVRCIKPNTKVESWRFDMDWVRPQLRCGGLVEAVRMLKVGFPTRVSFDEVYRQYSPLLNPQPTFPLNQRDFSQAVLFLFGLRRNEYQLGLSKVFFRAGKRAFLETVMNRDEKLSMDDMNALLGFIHRKKWQRLIAAAKSYALLWRSIALERLLQQWRATTRVLIIYQKTFVPALRRLRRANAARVVQAAVRTYQRRTETMNLLEKERLERQRVEMRERALKQQREQERKQKEEEERQKLLLQQQQQQEAAAYDAAVESQAAADGSASVGRQSRPQSTRASIGSMSGLMPSNVEDTKRIRELEEQNRNLIAQLKESNEEIERLKDVVDQLDDINNRLVEDLMNELVLRTQLSDEVAHHGGSPSSRTSSRTTTSNTQPPKDSSQRPPQATVQGYDASGGYTPSILPSVKVPSRMPDGVAQGARRSQRDSDCNVM